MKILRAIILTVGVVASVFVLIEFARTEYALWSMRDDRGFHLVTEPRVRIVRAVMNGHGEQVAWQLFAVGDPDLSVYPRIVFSFPSWPLVTIAGGMLVYSMLSIFTGVTHSAKRLDPGERS
jgi:hypothetical protein